MFTDGVFGTTDSGMLEVLLTQLRQNTISCSFVQVKPSIAGTIKFFAIPQIS